MPDIEKIIEGLNLPKQIIDKSEALFKALFGQSIGEYSGIMADNVRARRFKNQLKIFDEALRLIKEKGLNPKNISLKVLAPLIEYSSLEEEDLLQDKWAKLISNVLTKDLAVNFQQNSISILNKISSQEASIIDYMYHEFLKWRDNEFNIERERHQKWAETEGPNMRASVKDDFDQAEINSVLTFTRTLEDYQHSDLSFEIREMIEYFKLEHPIFELAISNLVALGIVKWQTEVKVINGFFEPKLSDYAEVGAHVIDDTNIKFTKLGFEFAVLCNS